MPPDWLTILARHSIAPRLVSAAMILYDIYSRGRRQPVHVMEAGSPITGLYTGPLRWLICARLGPGTARDCSTAQTASRAHVARTLHLGHALRRRLHTGSHHR
jgi:hypothetical protein